MKEDPWFKSLNLERRFFWANEKQQQAILEEIEFQREQGRSLGRRELKKELRVKLLDLLK